MYDAHPSVDKGYIASLTSLACFQTTGKKVVSLWRSDPERAPALPWLDTPSWCMNDLVGQLVAIIETGNRSPQNFIPYNYPARWQSARCSPLLIVQKGKLFVRSLTLLYSESALLGKPVTEKKQSRL